MKISNLTKALGDFKLDIGQLALDHDKVYGLMGGNGSGKSTLAKVIMGMVERDQGTIDYQDIGYQERTYMAQKPYILKRTLMDNISYPMEIRGQAIDYQTLAQVLEEAGLAGKEDQSALSLSSGEKQKVSFIRSLIFRPRLIIIDETFSNLDSESASLFMDWILAWQEKEPRLWIIISHQLGHLDRLCDEIIFLHEGKINKMGPKDEILAYQGQGPLKNFLRENTIGGRP